ncbi:MAG TPA: glycosyltransferase family 2 protein [Candidatus Acidoferrales bacterium]|nr:glycosyltransferase family 2 protein [Candidatus Acidoferrales bacterium]
MQHQAKPTVSVVIATRNRRPLLEQALASVGAQEKAGELFELETIVVDDASSDDTPEAMRRRNDIRYIRLDVNCGLASARNTGIEASSGDYIAFLDDDDLWLPYKLAVLLPVLEADPDSAVAYGQIIVRSENRVSVWPDARIAPNGSIFRELLRNSYAGMNSCLVRREAFATAGCFDETLRSNIDYDMSLRLAFHFRFRFVPAPVAIYRASRQGIFLSAAAEERTNFRRVIDKALALLEPVSPEDAQLGREARARVGLRVADLLDMTGDLERMRAHVLKALQEFPWIAGEPWARSWIARKVRRLALAAESPVAVAQAFAQQARQAAGPRGLRERLALRLLLSEIWAELASGLRAMRGAAREAGYAAFCAVLQNPAKLGPGLSLMIFRALITCGPARLPTVLRSPR